MLNEIASSPASLVAKLAQSCGYSFLYQGKYAVHQKVFEMN